MKSLVTLREAAKYLGTSKNKVWRAVDGGELPATKGKVKGQEAWKVALEDLEDWARVHMPELTEVPRETPEVSQGTAQNTAKVPRQTVEAPQSTSTKTFEAPSSNSFQAPTGEQILDRLEQAHRRSVVLELQLQQTQRLLVENTESQHEREARALEAEAKAEEEAQRRAEAERMAETAKQEAAQAKIEMETLRTEAEAKAKAEEALQLMATDLQALKTEMATKEIQWKEARKPWYKKLFRKSS
jgi:excisionase family DNA binding protein